VTWSIELGLTVRLNLVVLHVADIERSRRFYEAIGLTFAREQHDQGPVHYACDTDEMVVELYPSRTADSAPGDGPALTLGFCVSSIKAVAERVLALGDRRAAASYEPKGDRPLRLVDPDGHSVLLTASGDE
jgi:lactoylglutathione lyase